MENLTNVNYFYFSYPEKKYKIKTEQIVVDAHGPDERYSLIQEKIGDKDIGILSKYSLDNPEMVLLFSGYPLHKENRKNGKKNIPVREIAGNLEILPKHREFGLLKL